MMKLQMSSNMEKAGPYYALKVSQVFVFAALFAKAAFAVDPLHCESKPSVSEANHLVKRAGLQPTHYSYHLDSSPPTVSSPAYNYGSQSSHDIPLWQGRPRIFWEIPESQYAEMVQDHEKYVGQGSREASTPQPQLQSSSNKEKSSKRSLKGRKMLEQMAPSPQMSEGSMSEKSIRHLLLRDAGIGIGVMTGSLLVADQIKEWGQEREERLRREAQSSDIPSSIELAPIQRVDEGESEGDEDDDDALQHRLHKRSEFTVTPWNAPGFSNNFDPPPMVNSPDMYGQNMYPPPPLPQNFPTKEFGDFYNTEEQVSEARKVKSSREVKGRRKLKSRKSIHAVERDGIGFPPTDQAFVHPENLNSVVDLNAGGYGPGGIANNAINFGLDGGAAGIESGLGSGGDTTYPGQGSAGTYPGNNYGNNYGSGGFYSYHDPSASGSTNLTPAIVIGSIIGTGIVGTGAFYGGKYLVKKHKEGKDGGHTCEVEMGEQGRHSKRSLPIIPKADESTLHSSKIVATIDRLDPTTKVGPVSCKKRSVRWAKEHN